MKIDQLRKTILLAAVFAAAVTICSPLMAARQNSLLDMSDQLDGIEKQDFQAAIDNANDCTERRDFLCADLQIGKAAKLASGSRDQQRLASARQNMANEKTQIAEEERQRAEAEERQRVAEAERRQQQEASRSSGFQWGKLAAIGVGAAIGGVGHLSSEVQTKVITSAVKDSMAGQEGISNLKSTTDNLQTEQKARQAIAAQQRREQQAKATADEAASNERLLKAARESRQPNGGQRQSVSPSNPLPAYAGTNITTRIAQRPIQVALPAAVDDSWKTCGPNKKCLVGDGYSSFCSGPANPNLKDCRSECQMDSLVIYHDTRLPANVAYIPGDYKCPARTCNVINSCD